ncbi:MAG: 6-pyruvoyl tetrahydropterin synthase family protein [Robiginitomaculum sp.]|nr:6-pyruvoyl tetrahydropterin synthase family protein [Robiginitomaculum sp.]
MTKVDKFAALPMEITRAAWFEAAHYLHKCDTGQGYAQLHGHSFKMEITLRGVPTGTNGWVEDLARIGAALERIRAELDHGCLNDIEGLETPSLERICAWIAAKLAPEFSSLAVVRVSRPSLNEDCCLRL